MISEAEWQEQVIELAHLLGWNHMHCRRSIGRHGKWVTATNIAWPDLTLWSEDQERIVFAELKTDTGRLTQSQAATIASLRNAGCEVHMWCPRDFDLVKATLERKPA